LCLSLALAHDEGRLRGDTGPFLPADPWNAQACGCEIDGYVPLPSACLLVGDNHRPKNQRAEPGKKPLAIFIGKLKLNLATTLDPGLSEWLQQLQLCRHTIQIGSAGDFRPTSIEEHRAGRIADFLALKRFGKRQILESKLDIPTKVFGWNALMQGDVRTDMACDQAGQIRRRQVQKRGVNRLERGKFCDSGCFTGDVDPEIAYPRPQVRRRNLHGAAAGAYGLAARQTGRAAGEADEDVGAFKFHPAIAFADRGKVTDQIETCTVHIELAGHLVLCEGYTISQPTGRNDQTEITVAYDPA